MNLKQHPRTFSRLFGLTPEQFDRFITQADPLWTESETKRRNTRHSRARIVVEHIFASLKTWHILQDRFRGHRANYHQYFAIVCGLHNLARA